MKIQVNTDKNIQGREDVAGRVTEIVEDALQRFSDHVTRIEIHLSDENSHKSGQEDKRCLMEARLEGRQPIAVREQSDTVEKAVSGAADKLKRSLESTFGRLQGR